MKIKKLLYEITCILLITLILFSSIIVTNAANSVVFKIDTLEIPVNTPVASIPISIIENGGYTGADITIVCSLAILGIEPVGINAVSNIANGKVNWTFIKNNTKTGPVLNVTFAIPKDSKPGDSWPVSMRITDLINEDLKPVPVNIESGSITIKKLSSIYNNYGEKKDVYYKQNDCNFSSYYVSTNLPANVIWTSSDESVATIDKDGHVTTHSKGTTYIIATTADNLTAVTQLNVKYTIWQRFFKILFLVLLGIKI